MAPRKKADEKPSANEAADMVLHYLRKQNRPYSAIDVSANLHNKVTKASAAKILKDLHEQRQIEGRTAGKQIVYHATQHEAMLIPSTNADESCTAEQLAALDARIDSLRVETSTLLATAKALRATLATLNSTLSTADLITSVHNLEAERATILNRLEALKAGKAKKVTKEEHEKVDKEWKVGVRMAMRREVIAKNMWMFIADQIPEKEKREELREAFDLDG